MKTKSKFKFLAVVLFLSFIVSCNDDLQKTTSTDVTASTAKKTNLNVKVSNFGQGMLAYPRGHKFGPDGNLYVALAGMAGTTSTAGQCGENVLPGVQSLSGLTGKVIKITPDGTTTTVIDQLPSAKNGFGDTQGPSDVAFINNDLYVLLVAGCSHGSKDYPSAVLKVNTSTKKATIVADLSRYLHNNPVAAPEADDFEPDGTPYSMVSVRGDLYVVEPNHGELIKVTTSGQVSRVLDFSSVYGHIVPTAVAYDGNFFVGNLGTFPVQTGSSNIYKVTPSGQSKIVETGFSAVLGVAFDRQSRMYVLEALQSGFPAPGPGTGRVIRINGDHSRDILVDNLLFPTGIVFGPDGALYVSNTGFGPPNAGQILKVEF